MHFLLTFASRTYALFVAKFTIPNTYKIPPFCRFFVADTLTLWREQGCEPTKGNEAKLNKITAFCKMLAEMTF